jgi:hypothetical protein
VRSGRDVSVGVWIGRFAAASVARGCQRGWPGLGRWIKRSADRKACWIWRGEAVAA